MHNDPATEPMIGNTTLSERAPEQRRRYSAEFKRNILETYSRLSRSQKARFLSEEGLSTALVSQWKKQWEQAGLQALEGGPGRRPKDPVQKELATLRQEIEKLRGIAARQDNQGNGEAQLIKNRNNTRSTDHRVQKASGSL